MRLDELCDQRRNVNAPETERRDDVQAAGQAAARAGESAGQGVDLLEQALRLGHQALALAGEADMTRAAHHQVDSQRTFQLLEPHGERGRRHVQRARGGAERAGAVERIHEPQVVERDHSISLKPIFAST
jgi:hypothetical protein